MDAFVREVKLHLAPDRESLRLSIAVSDRGTVYKSKMEAIVEDVVDPADLKVIYRKRTSLFRCFLVHKTGY